MATLEDAESSGVVVSLHLHPEISGQPMNPVTRIEVKAAEGIVGESRYFQKRNRRGQSSRRLLSLMEREQMVAHAADLGLDRIDPGRVRANVETSGTSLTVSLGRRLRIGGAPILFYEARTPCERMDAVCQGLRARMENGRQGVLAEIIEGGSIQVGDRIEPVGLGGGTD